MRISYPALFEPKENLSGVMKFSCSLLIPKTDKKGVEELRAEVAKAIARGKEKVWGGAVPKFRYEPIRDGDEELATGEKKGAEYKGMYFVNCSSDNPPGVVGPDAKPLMDQRDIFAGCWVRADINPFPYKKGVNNGIGWGLNNIMLSREDERLDGRQKAEDAFAEYAGGDEGETLEDEGNLM